jgi:hypothetical protein
MLTVGTVMKKGKTCVTPAQREANILIELLRDLEVPSRKMSFEFNCYELWHAVVLLHRIRSMIGPMPNAGPAVPAGRDRQLWETEI